VELIGSAKSPDAFDFLAGQLRAADLGVRHQAIWALKKLDTKESRKLLWQARSFTLGSPEETEEFRRDLGS
jgi:HEAT repeat protein